MATVGVLKQEVLDHQFSSRYATRIITWLDEAQKEIYRQVPALWDDDGTSSTNIVSGDHTISLPSDFGSIKGVYYSVTPDTGNYIRLQKLSDDEYETNADLSAGSASTPYAYHIEGSGGSNFLELPNISDGSYTIQILYNRVPETLTDGSTPKIPEEYHHYLVDYALWKAYASEHDLTWASYHQNEWKSHIQTIQSDMHKALEDGPEQVPGHWSNVESSLPSIRIP